VFETEPNDADDFSQDGGGEGDEQDAPADSPEGIRVPLGEIPGCGTGECYTKESGAHGAPAAIHWAGSVRLSAPGSESDSQVHLCVLLVPRAGTVTLVSVGDLGGFVG